MDPAPPNQIASMARRLKIAEETITNLRKKLQINEQNLLESQKNQHVELSTFGQELDEIKQTVYDMKKDMELIIKELQLTAKQEDVKVLEKYINMWEPVSFVTAKEVQRIVARAIKDESHTSNTTAQIPRTIQ